MAKDILKTKLCDLLDIEYPIILAGMSTGSPVAGPTLAAAVSNAGGLGVVGASGYSPDELDQAIKKVKSLTSKPFGIDLLVPSDVPQMGSREELEAQIPQEHRAFVAELVKEFNVPKPTKEPRPLALTQELMRRQVDVCIENNVPVFASGLGNPAWMVPDAHKAGMKVIGLVGNVRNALRVAAGGVDILVAQGHDAGGHTGRIGTMALVPQVVDAVAPLPVVAAGGIGDGRGVLAALMLGAIGVWCGTAFLASYEANIDATETGDAPQWFVDYWHQRLIEASEEDTVVSRTGSGKPARSLRNQWHQAWDRPNAPKTLPMPLQGLLIEEFMAGAMEAGIKEVVGMPTGQITGLIKQLKPARQIVNDIMNQARQIIEETGLQEAVRR